MNTIQERRQRYYRLSAQLAQLDNGHLQVGATPGANQVGWGGNQVIEVEETAVFVKRIPITALEYEQMFSTRNMYDLPLFYQYRFGSVGMGVFRELVTHVKTTNWVLAGERENFPLLYHYRIVPAIPRGEMVDMAYHGRYMAYWGGDENIGRYLLDRAAAPYELVLYLEHFPHTVATWLRSHSGRLPEVTAEAQKTLAFLHTHDVLHLDAHLSNWLTDGKRVYLTDFGLSLDKGFALTAGEKQFFQSHKAYDYGNLVWGVGTHLYGLYLKMDDHDKQRVKMACQIEEEMGFEEILFLLLGQMDVLVNAGLIPLGGAEQALIQTHLPAILLMHRFYVTMRGNDGKDTPLPRGELEQLLVSSGFVAFDAFG